MFIRCVVGALASLFAAGIARADCNYTVSPGVSLSDEGPWDGGAGVATALDFEDLAATWSINCQGACRDNWQESGGVTFNYAAAPTLEVEPGCDNLGDQVGQGVCVTLAGGVNVVAVVSGMCGDGFQGSGNAVMVTSAPLVIPPSVGDSTDVFAFPSDASSLINFTDDEHVPVGVPFRMSGAISVTPAGSDVPRGGCGHALHAHLRAVARW